MSEVGRCCPPIPPGSPQSRGGKKSPKTQVSWQEMLCLPSELAPLVPTGSSRQQDSAASLNTGQKS